MPDFRIDESAAEHRKFRVAGPAAAGIWALAGAYAMKNATDGWVPEYWVATWPAGKKHATSLVRVGLWVPEERDGVPGYGFHDWNGYQRSTAQVEEEKRKARERMAALRAGGGRDRPPPHSAGSVRPNNGCTLAATDAEGSPHVHDSRSLSLGGSVAREGSRSVRGDDQDPTTLQDSKTEEELARCGRPHDDSQPCQQCRDLRKAEKRADAEARQLVRDCPMCDADGWLHEAGSSRPVSPYQRCDHQSDHHLQVKRAREAS